MRYSLILCSILLFQSCFGFFVPTGSETRVPTSGRIETTQLYLTEDEVTELLSVVVKKGRPSYPAWKSSRRKKLNEMAECK